MASPSEEGQLPRRPHCYPLVAPSSSGLTAAHASFPILHRVIFSPLFHLQIKRHKGEMGIFPWKVRTFPVCTV